MTPILIGIAGGSGSGKTRLANELQAEVGPDRVSIIPFDAYYKDLRKLSFDDRQAVNFDHPDSLDADLFGYQLDGLLEGLDVAIPVYDFSQHQRADDLDIRPASEIIIAEGILLFAFPELAERFDFKIFRECSEETRFARRLERDINERGRSEENIRAQFEASVAPMHDKYVEPTKSLADRVVRESEDLSEVVAELATTICSLPV